jgi:hypothetical protein
MRSWLGPKAPRTAAPLAGYKDRRTGCIVLGVIPILLGAACALVALLTLLVASIAPPDTGFSSVFSGLVFNALLAVAFVWLGIGSILCRRWARTLLLILAWSWLVAGLTIAAVLAAVLPQMASMIGWGVQGLVAMLAVLAVLGLPLVVVPAAMVLFYQNRHVQATFEARDPHPRWTDACPLPVLTTALWLALGAVSVVPVIIGGSAFVPLFGRLISGRPAALWLLAGAGISVWLAWGFWRLQRVALWVSLALTLLAAASTTVTFARVDFLEVYRLMGYPQDQIDAVRQIGLLGGQTMAWMMALLGVATCAFLVWLQKFFPASSSPGSVPPGQGTLTRT